MTKLPVVTIEPRKATTNAPWGKEDYLVKVNGTIVADFGFDPARDINFLLVQAANAVANELWLSELGKKQ